LPADIRVTLILLRRVPKTGLEETGLRSSRNPGLCLTVYRLN